MRAIQVTELGGPEVLKLVELPEPDPGPGEVLIRVAAAGINFTDTLRRTGHRLTPPLPHVPGLEVAGTVARIGPGVGEPVVGTRVLAWLPGGGYAEMCLASTATVAPVPDALSDQQAAALQAQGLTAYHCLKTIGRLAPGETVLVHAAAGGVGTQAIQQARIMGAEQVIGTASTDEKLALVRSLGATATINYVAESFGERVKELTDGRGADVILEAVGGSVFEESLQCLAPLGRLVIYGTSSGQRRQLDQDALMQESRSVGGFYMTTIRAQPQLLHASLNELIGWAAGGQLQTVIGSVYPLGEAAAAHEQMEARQTTGKLLLVP
ncbi:MAG: alcohol dehydrogenase [Dehalococcoidia bacterium]|nr:alcohol dehydrogenase [Dehalococcoidia bacterium]